jgi:hypothetical protein
MSVHEPSHAALMWATLSTPMTSKQLHRKFPIEISWLPLRPVFDSTGRLDRPFGIAPESIEDQWSSISI